MATEELRTVEARQGDRRKMNMRALFWGVPAAFILMAIVGWLWA